MKQILLFMLLICGLSATAQRYSSQQNAQKITNLQNLVSIENNVPTANTEAITQRARISSGTYQSAALASDTCESAINLGTLTSPYQSSTIGATNDFNQNCASGTAPDLVYYITVPTGSTLNIGQTVNNYDSVNYVGYGGTCPGTTQIDCFNDPDNKQVSWTNNTGTSQVVYWVQDGYNTASGTFTLAWNIVPPCGMPSSLSTYSTSNTSVNLNWTAPATGQPTGYQYAVTTSATPPATGTAVTNTFVNGYTIAANTVYYLHVRSNCSGTFTPWVTSDSFRGGIAGNGCYNAINLSYLTSPYSSTTVGASNNVNPCTNSSGPDLVYYIPVPNNAILTIGQIANNYDSFNNLYYGSFCSGGTSITCFDEPDLRQVTWTNTTGTTQNVYWVQDGQATTSAGTFTLAWSLTTTCGMPTSVAATATSATNANISWAEPSIGPASSYQYAVTTSLIPPATGTDTTTTSVNGITIAAGVQHYVHVRTNCSGTYSPWVTSLPFTGAAAGDTCSSAIDLATLTSPYTSTTTGATNDITSTCGGATAPDKVFYITVPKNATLSLSQPSNNYDSINYVGYSGTCPGTREISCFDDPEDTVVNWTNTTGSDQKVYWVQDGFGNSSGTFTLAWTLTRPVCNTPLPTATAQLLTQGSTVANLQANGQNLQWYVTATTPVAMPLTTDLVTQTYYVSQTIGTCESARVAVNVTVFQPLPDANGIIYVRKGATGNGTSWLNAINELGEALIAARNLNALRAGTVSQIWVSGGTYKPMYRADNFSSANPNDRDNVFVLVDNVKVYGGFAGTETAVSQRNLATITDKTILSGDINDDDVYDPVTGKPQSGNTENRRRIVTCTGRSTALISANTLLDGFTIRGGYGDDNFSVGAGIYNSFSLANYNNLTLSGNYANRGAAFYNTDKSAGTMSNLIITGNIARTGAGGMYNANSGPAITNVLVASNTVLTNNQSSGGGMEIWDSSPAPFLTNVTVTNNIAPYSAGIEFSGATVRLRNCIIYNNRLSITNTISNVTTTGGANGFPTPIYYNCLIQGIETGVWANFGTDGGNNIDGNPLFTNPANGDYTLQAASPAVNNGNSAYYNTNASPNISGIVTDLANYTRIKGFAVDMGPYEYQEATLPNPVTDANGIFYVKKGATGNGSSWNNALGELAYALKAAKQKNDITTGAVSEIWVAGGIYKPLYKADDLSGPRPAHRDNAFVLVNKVKIYGGFAGTETALSQRNLTITANKSILSGDFIGNDTYTTMGAVTAGNDENAYHVLISVGGTSATALTTATVVDGFTVIGGFASGVANNDTSRITVNGALISRSAGGAMFNSDYASPTLSNLIITGNKSGGPGGAIYNYSNCSPILKYITLSGNTGGTYGGAIYNIYSSSPIISNSTIIANTASYGGGLYNNGGAPILNDVIITENSVLNYGSGIYNISCSPKLNNVTISRNTGAWAAFSSINSSSPVLTNVTIADNTAISSYRNYGAGISQNTGTLIFTNGRLTGNSISGGTEAYGAGLYSTGATLTLTNVTIAGNSAAASSISQGGGMMLNNSTVAVRNSILYGNIATTGTNVYNTASTPIYNYSLVQGSNTGWAPFGTNGSGNIDLTPMFTDAANGDYTLLATSPAVDTGNNAYFAAGATPDLSTITTDLAGSTRISGTAVDMGPYEYRVCTTPVPTGAAAQAFCSSATVANLTATGTALKWYTAATGGTALAATTALATNTTYYASQTLNTCESVTRFPVAVSINVTLAPIGAAAQTFCNSATVANLTATGTALKWYTTATGGTALAATAALATNTTYYASQTLNACESATRFAVAVTINATPVPTGTAAQIFCNSATVANLTATGTALKWYAVATGGTALAANAALANNTTYYASQTLNTCESVTRFPVAVSINVTLAPIGAAAQTFCNSATVANLTATGTALKWYTTATGGTALVTTTPLANSTTYYASQTLNACESATRFPVAVIINTTVAPTASAQTLPAESTVANLAAAGTNLKWYNVATGGSALTSTNLLATGNYYVSQTINGCESQRVLVAIIVSVVITPDANGILYVKKNSTGNGSSWVNALGEVADALKAAKQLNDATAGTISQIWVAGGTYKPLYRADNLNGNNPADRDNAFVMVNNIKVYGNFAGTEATLNQRDLAVVTNKSILSGDFNGDDIYNANGQILSNNTENAYHLVVSVGSVSSPVTTNTIIDGFTLIGANANGFSGSCLTVYQYCLLRNSGGAIFNYYSSLSVYNTIITGNNAFQGGGFFNYYSSPAISNCIVKGNTTIAAGGIYNEHSSPILTNVTIAYNSGSQSGGGIYNIFDSSPTLTNVNINNNTSNYGGGIFNSSSSPVLTNVSIVGNSAQSGGGFYNTSSSLPIITNVIIDNNSAYNGAGIYNNNSLPTLTNVKITNNTAIETGGGIINYSSSPVLTNVVISNNSAVNGSGIINNYSSPKIRNSIIYGNPATTGNNIFNDVGTPEYYNSLIQGSSAGWTNFGINGGGNIDVSPLFTNAVGGDYTLQSTSPAINAGNNAYYAIGATPDISSVNTDLLGFARIQGTSVDMGAYEFGGQAPCATPAPVASAQLFCGNATVANLTATGTTLKWYSTLTGGTALATTTTLNNATYYVSQTLNGCEGPRTAVTITVNPVVTPAFTALAPICSGATLATLPTTSTNGITGTWSPTLNNTATTTYTFTPTAGQCANTATLTITVNPIVMPTFTAVAPICSGATLATLPTTSTNGITGTWSPAMNNTATTTYTFTPTAGQCANTASLTITVNPVVIPTFTAVAPICSGATLATLPTTSTNGITGTWSPALNNTATTTYTFTPTAGQCANTTTLTITVNPVVTPAFTAVAPICSGATLAALPTTSTNGITGTWSPALNNTATTTYTFTPTAGQCANTTTLTITVNPIVTPTFTAVAPICSGATLAVLPTTSTNGIAGTWSPALNNTATTTYTFTPTAGQCANNTTLTITVNLIDNSTLFTAETITANQTGATYQWVDCANGSIPIDGASEQSFTATVNGQYAVIIEMNGCTTTSECVTISTLSTKDFEANNKLVVYPSPANTILNIETTEIIKSVKIVDLLGKTITINNFSENKIDVSALEEGTYFIEIRTDQKAYVKKFVKIK